MKRNDSSECPNLEVLDPVCQRSMYPPIDEYVSEATALALCGVKPTRSRERSSEWLQVVRGQTYRQPGVLINNWFDEGQDIVHLQRNKSILSDVRCQLSSVSSVINSSLLPSAAAKQQQQHYYYLCQVNGVNGGDTVFVLCVSVCFCVSVRSGPVNQTSLKWLKLRTSILTRMFPGTVRT